MPTLHEVKQSGYTLYMRNTANASECIGKPGNLLFGPFVPISQVDLSFRPSQSLPASHAHLQVTAAPQSLCALRAVDQSVLLMKPDAELSASSVSSQQPQESRRAMPGAQSKEKCLDK